MQVVCSSHRGSRDIEHIGSAHDDAELEVLKAVARQCVAANQGSRPPDLCLAMARRDSHPRGARLDCQASASLETAWWRAWWLLLHRGEGPVRDWRAARSERKRRRPWLALGGGRAQTLRHRRRSASWAFQRSSDAFCPALDLGPVAVVAQPAAESMEEQARGQWPLMSLDRASEDPVLARVNRILELADLPGLAPHQLADPTMRVTERTDTEQPHWPRGKCGAVGAQELGRARDPALVVDAAAENDRVVSREVIDVIDWPGVNLASGFCEPGGDSLGNTSSGSVLGRVGDENARALAHAREPTPGER